MPFPFWEGDSLFLSFFSRRVRITALSCLLRLQSNRITVSFNDLWQLPSLPLLKVLTKLMAWLISEKDAAIQFKHIFRIKSAGARNMKKMSTFCINSNAFSYL